MKNFVNNRLGALITILILTVGLISIVGIIHIAKASQIGEACVIFACGNANITGGTSGSSLLGEFLPPLPPFPPIIGGK